MSKSWIGPPSDLGSGVGGGMILDEPVPVALADPYPARYEVPMSADIRMHAMMTGWQHRPFWIGAYLKGSDTTQVSYKVPPNVKEVVVSVLVSGEATVTVTGSNEVAVDTSSGDQPIAAGDVFDHLGVARIVEMPEPITLVASPTWDYYMATFEVESVSHESTLYSVVWGIMIQPIHRWT